jgi:hypothetical protein
MSAPYTIVGFKLVWCDYTGYVEGSRRLLKHGKKHAVLPPVHVEQFRTKAEAEAAHAQLKATHGDGLVASVVPITVKPPEPLPLLDGLPLMQKRLTR